MRRFRGCLMVAFIFGCGFFVGGVAGAALGWVGFFHKVTRGGPHAVGEIVMDRAVHDLKLKPEQRERVRAILRETGEELRTATAGAAPQVQEIMARNSERLRSELTAEQQKKFDNFAGQARRRWIAAWQARRAVQPAIPGAASPAPLAKPTPAASNDESRPPRDPREKDPGGAPP